MSAVVYGGQKKSLDSLELELQVIGTAQCWFWELNLGSLEEKPMNALSY